MEYHGREIDVDAHLERYNYYIKNNDATIDIDSSIVYDLMGRYSAVENQIANMQCNPPNIPEFLDVGSEMNTMFETVKKTENLINENLISCNRQLEMAIDELRHNDVVNYVDIDFADKVASLKSYVRGDVSIPIIKSLLEKPDGNFFRKLGLTINGNKATLNDFDNDLAYEYDFVNGKLIVKDINNKNTIANINGWYYIPSVVENSNAITMAACLRQMDTLTIFWGKSEPSVEYSVKHDMSLERDYIFNTNGLESNDVIAVVEKTRNSVYDDNSYYFTKFGRAFMNNDETINGMFEQGNDKAFGFSVGGRVPLNHPEVYDEIVVYDSGVKNMKNKNYSNVKTLYLQSDETSADYNMWWREAGLGGNIKRIGGDHRSSRAREYLNTYITGGIDAL